MLLLKSNFGIVIITLLFILTNGYLAYLGNYYLVSVPFILFAIYLSVLSLDKFFFAAIFFIPLSVPLQLFAPDLGFNLQLPTEPMLIVITFLMCFKFLYNSSFDRKVILHPVSVAILVSLSWILITTLFSSMPLVSFKYLLSRLWFIIPFYFLSTQLFYKKNKMPKYVWAYIFPLIFVICYALYNLIQSGGLFNQHKANMSPFPFFNDHTEYGAVMAMLLPFGIGLALNKRYSDLFKMFMWLLVMFIIVALVFSYCRAAWLSIFVALFAFLMLVVKVKMRWYILGVIFAGIIVFLYRTEIYDKLAHNHQDSSKSFDKHLQSMSNISTDESNLERINRWNSAFRMFREKPILGWGPGTYMFNYASFQRPSEKTSISTNLGDRGNAHSEYIQALTESGILGLATYLAIIIATMFTSLKVYRNDKATREIKIFVICAALGLITYYVHGGVNDFLLNDKVSALFWGYTAMIVMLDIRLEEKNENTSIKLNT